MGTKVEYSINVLATSVDSNNLRVGGAVDVWEQFQNKVLRNNHHRIAINYKLQDPMDRRILDRNSIEYIRKTMQMQEEAFKHQVRELHRVYNVQKMLMDELKREISQQKLWNPMNGSDVSHSHLIQQQQHHQTTRSSYGFDYLGSREMPRGFDLEKRPAHEEILIGSRGFDEGEAGPNSTYAALQSCKISNDEEEVEVDLTLSIGGSQVKKSSHHNVHQDQIQLADSATNEKTRELNSSSANDPLKLDRVEECSNEPSTPMSSSSVTCTKERKGPHWLSQGLKLKQ